MRIIEINGVKYTNKPQKNDAAARKVFNKTIALSLMFGINMPEIKPRKRPSIDVEKEFELIQQKKSNLSKSDRDWVVSVFNEMYVPLEEATIKIEKP